MTYGDMTQVEINERFAELEALRERHDTTDPERGVDYYDPKAEPLTDAEREYMNHLEDWAEEQRAEDLQVAGWWHNRRIDGSHQ